MHTTTTPLPPAPTRTLTRALLSLANALTNALDRHQPLIATLLTAFLILSALGAASHLPFTYDEQVTYRTARLPIPALWAFFSQGLDTTGPVPALIAHLALPLPQSPEIKLRLPFLLAFAALGLALWSFLRPRYPSGFALAALILPVEFATLCFFRTDARAYALMLFAAAAAIRLWQRAALPARRIWTLPALWLVLAFGMSAHFFTLFVFLPLAAAQLTRDLDRRPRRPDWPVWAALTLFPLGWLPLAPGEHRAHLFYATTFWSKPTLNNLGDAYGQMITPNWPILLVLPLFFLCAALALTRSTKPALTPAPQTTGLLKPEWVLTLTFLALPPIIWLFSHALGAFHHYYTDTFAIGMILAIVATAAELSHRSRPLGLLFFAMILTLVLADNSSDALDGFHALLDHGQAHLDISKNIQATDWIQQLNQSNLPVAADNAPYAKLDFYATPALAARSYALTDLPQASKYPNAMTDQNNMRLFGSRLGYNPQDASQFLHQHPHFLLVQQRTPFPDEWATAYLLDPANPCHPQLQVRAQSDDVFLFEVSTHCP